MATAPAAAVAEEASHRSASSIIALGGRRKIECPPTTACLGIADASENPSARHFQFYDFIAGHRAGRSPYNKENERRESPYPVIVKRFSPGFVLQEFKTLAYVAYKTDFPNG